MFLSNVRTALIVAINVPLALLFALAVLFLRGEIGQSALDRRRRLRHHRRFVGDHRGEYLPAPELRTLHADLPINQRILRASSEVQRSCLFSSRPIMVCAFLPLFTMAGPEGQIFGPMAETYAFALGGALLLALVLSPVLCALFFQEAQAPPRQLAGAGLADELPAAVATLPATSRADAGGFRRDRGGHRGSGARSWAASSCPNWRRATSGSQAPFPLKTSLDEVCAVSQKAA